MAEMSKAPGQSALPEGGGIPWTALCQESLERLYESVPGWEDLNGKTLLLTGASGMIGSFLTDALMLRNQSLPPAARTRILAVGRGEAAARRRFWTWWDEESFRFLPHDAAQPFPDLPWEPDLLIHAASTTHPADYAARPIETVLTNLLGTRNLLDLAVRKPGCRLLLLSSVEIYGENRGDTDRFAEDYCGYLDCNALRAGYPEGKRASEALCQAYIAERGADAVILRLPRCYGPTMRMEDTKASSQFLKKALRGEDIVLKSEGRQFYSYAYVCDAVQGLLRVLLAGETGEAYNLGDPASDITLRELAELCASLAGRQVRYELPDEAERRGYSTATKALLDGTKLKERLGWRPRYTIREGIGETVEILRRLYGAEGTGKGGGAAW